MAREQCPSKVKVLCWLLTHALEAKLLAVKRIRSSQGAKTFGVDAKLYQKDAELCNKDEKHICQNIEVKHL